MARINELYSHTSEAIMNSAPNSRHAVDGITQATPPSTSRRPSRATGRRKYGIAQLALMAEPRGPSVIVTTCRSGTAVATATKGRDSFAKVSRSEEHTSELQSRPHLVCRLLLEK